MIAVKKRESWIVRLYRHFIPEDRFATLNDDSIMHYKALQAAHKIIHGIIAKAKPILPLEINFNGWKVNQGLIIGAGRFTDSDSFCLRTIITPWGRIIFDQQYGQNYNQKIPRSLLVESQIVMHYKSYTDNTYFYAVERVQDFRLPTPNSPHTNARSSKTAQKAWELISKEL